MTDYLEMAQELGIRGRVSGEQLFARCPLHHDSAPSFDMKLSNGAWTCHRGCGPERGRTFVRLVMLVNDVNYTEASRWILQHKRVQQPTIAELSGRINRILKPVAEAAPEIGDGEAQAYWESATAAQIPLWFLRRGFTWETIRFHGIRYDAIRDGILIPVRDYTGGEFLGVVVRYGSGERRYWNSPRLPKSSTLYSLTPQDAGRRIIIVEGPLDAMYLRQETGESAVACFGDSVSADQLALLRRVEATGIIIAFDNDAAGRTATLKTARKLYQSGWMYQNVRQVVWPGGRKDANECSKAELENMMRSLTGCLV